MIKRIIAVLKRVIYGKISPVKYARSIGVRVGDDCKLESLNFGTEPWLIEIHNHVEVTGDVHFITHDGATWVIRNWDKYRSVLKFGKIVLDDNCYIGQGAIILPDVIVGKNSVVGAGSVVTKNVPDNSVVGGVPARFICTIEEYADKCLSTMPEYDMNNYKKDKRTEVIRALESRRL